MVCIQNEVISIYFRRFFFSIDHAPPEELEDFLSEIDILKRIGEHPNIVKLIGCCTLKQPYMMVMELVPCGSLKSYLLKLRKRWENYKTNDSVFLE